jgi:acyl carrier protein
VISEESFVRLAGEFLRERLGDRAEHVDADTELVASGLLDSLLVLEFFFFLEGIEGVAIKPEEASVDALSTLRSAYRLVVKP